MVDVSVPLGVSDYHDGVLHDEMLCFPPSVEEDNCNQGAEKIEINGDLHSPTPHRSPTPDKGLPGKRVYSIKVFA
jgi:ubiquitin carboxyl-terminal hydrolase 36/42